MTPMSTRIARYVERITPGLVEDATRSSIGDCLLCLRTAEGVPAGDVVGDTEHLVIHMKERYYPGMLFRNSWDEMGGSGTPPHSLNELRFAVSAYLTKRLVG